jgi:hypothetical protein
MKKKTAALLLCAWLTGTLVMWFVATENFRTVDRVLATANAEFARSTGPLAAGETRIILRYLASELNRFYFRTWNWVQLVLGVVVLGLLWAERGSDRLTRQLTLGMIILIGVMIGYFTPTIVSLGRGLDFAARQPPPPGLGRFWRLHTIYMALDAVKVGVGVWSLVRLTRSEKA